MPYQIKMPADPIKYIKDTNIALLGLAGWSSTFGQKVERYTPPETSHAPKDLFRVTVWGSDEERERGDIISYLLGFHNGDPYLYNSETYQRVTPGALPLNASGERSIHFNFETKESKRAGLPKAHLTAMEHIAALTVGALYGNPGASHDKSEIMHDLNAAQRFQTTLAYGVKLKDEDDRDVTIPGMPYSVHFGETSARDIAMLMRGGPVISTQGLKGTKFGTETTVESQIRQIAESGGLYGLGPFNWGINQVSNTHRLVNPNIFGYENPLTGGISSLTKSFLKHAHTGDRPYNPVAIFSGNKKAWLLNDTEQYKEQTAVLRPGDATGRQIVFNSLIPTLGGEGSRQSGSSHFMAPSEIMQQITSHGKRAALEATFRSVIDVPVEGFQSPHDLIMQINGENRLRFDLAKEYTPEGLKKRNVIGSGSNVRIADLLGMRAGNVERKRIGITTKERHAMVTDTVFKLPIEWLDNPQYKSYIDDVVIPAARQAGFSQIEYEATTPDDRGRRAVSVGLNVMQGEPLALKNFTKATNSAINRSMMGLWMPNDKGNMELQSSADAILPFKSPEGAIWSSFNIADRQRQKKILFGVAGRNKEQRAAITKYYGGLGENEPAVLSDLSEVMGIGGPIELLSAMRNTVFGKKPIIRGIQPGGPVVDQAVLDQQRASNKKYGISRDIGYIPIGVFTETTKQSFMDMALSNLVKSGGPKGRGMSEEKAIAAMRTAYRFSLGRKLDDGTQLYEGYELQEVIRGKVGANPIAELSGVAKEGNEDINQALLASGNEDIVQFRRRTQPEMGATQRALYDLAAARSATIEKSSPMGQYITIGDKKTNYKTGMWNREDFASTIHGLTSEESSPGDVLSALNKIIENRFGEGLGMRFATSEGDVFLPSIPTLQRLDSDTLELDADDIEGEISTKSLARLPSRALKIMTNLAQNANVSGTINNYQRLADTYLKSGNLEKRQFGLYSPYEVNTLLEPGQLFLSKQAIDRYFKIIGGNKFNVKEFEGYFNLFMKPVLGAGIRQPDIARGSPGGLGSVQAFSMLTEGNSDIGREIARMQRESGIRPMDVTASPAIAGMLGDADADKLGVYLAIGRATGDIGGFMNMLGDLKPNERAARVKELLAQTSAKAQTETMEFLMGGVKPKDLALEKDPYAANSLLYLKDLMGGDEANSLWSKLPTKDINTQLAKYLESANYQKQHAMGDTHNQLIRRLISSGMTLGLEPRAYSIMASSIGTKHSQLAVDQTYKPQLLVNALKGAYLQTQNGVLGIGFDQDPNASPNSDLYNGIIIPSKDKGGFDTVISDLAIKAMRQDNFSPRDYAYAFGTVDKKFAKMVKPGMSWKERNKIANEMLESYQPLIEEFTKIAQMPIDEQAGAINELRRKGKIGINSLYGRALMSRLSEYALNQKADPTKAGRWADIETAGANAGHDLDEVLFSEEILGTSDVFSILKTDKNLSGLGAWKNPGTFAGVARNWLKLGMETNPDIQHFMDFYGGMHGLAFKTDPSGKTSLFSTKTGKFISSKKDLAEYQRGLRTYREDIPLDELQNADEVSGAEILARQGIPKNVSTIKEPLHPSMVPSLAHPEAEYAEENITKSVLTGRYGVSRGLLDQGKDKTAINAGYKFEDEQSKGIVEALGLEDVSMNVPRESQAMEVPANKVTSLGVPVTMKMDIAGVNPKTGKFTIVDAKYSMSHANAEKKVKDPRLVRSQIATYAHTLQDLAVNSTQQEFNEFIAPQFYNKDNKLAISKSELERIGKSWRSAILKRGIETFISSGYTDEDGNLRFVDDIKASGFDWTSEEVTSDVNTAVELWKKINTPRTPENTKYAKSADVLIDAQGIRRKIGENSAAQIKAEANFSPEVVADAEGQNITGVVSSAASASGGTRARGNKGQKSTIQLETDRRRFEEGAKLLFTENGNLGLLALEGIGKNAFFQKYGLASDAETITERIDAIRKMKANNGMSGGDVLSFYMRNNPDAAMSLATLKELQKLSKNAATQGYTTIEGMLASTMQGGPGKKELDKVTDNNLGARLQQILPLLDENFDPPKKSALWGWGAETKDEYFAANKRYLADYRAQMNYMRRPSPLTEKELLYQKYITAEDERGKTLTKLRLAEDAVNMPESMRTSRAFTASNLEDSDKFEADLARRKNALKNSDYASPAYSQLLTTAEGASQKAEEALYALTGPKGENARGQYRVDSEFRANMTAYAQTLKDIKNHTDDYIKLMGKSKEELKAWTDSVKNGTAVHDIAIKAAEKSRDVALKAIRQALGKDAGTGPVLTPKELDIIGTGEPGTEVQEFLETYNKESAKIDAITAEKQELLMGNSGKSRLGQAARNVLSGFGLMYMRSIMGMVAGASETGYAESVQYNAGLNRAMVSQFGAQEGYNPEADIAGYKALMGGGGKRVMNRILSSIYENQPGLVDVGKSAFAGLAGAGSTMWFLSQVAPKFAAIGPAGLAAGLLVGAGSYVMNQFGKASDQASWLAGSAEGYQGYVDRDQTKVNWMWQDEKGASSWSTLFKNIGYSTTEFGYQFSKMYDFAQPWRSKIDEGSRLEKLRQNAQNQVDNGKFEDLETALRKNNVSKDDIFSITKGEMYKITGSMMPGISSEGRISAIQQAMHFGVSIDRLDEKDINLVNELGKAYDSGVDVANITSSLLQVTGNLYSEDRASIFKSIALSDLTGLEGEKLTNLADFAKAYPKWAQKNIGKTASEIERGIRKIPTTGATGGGETLNGATWDLAEKYSSVISGPNQDLFQSIVTSQELALTYGLQGIKIPENIATISGQEKIDLMGKADRLGTGLGLIQMWSAKSGMNMSRTAKYFSNLNATGSIVDQQKFLNVLQSPSPTNFGIALSGLSQDQRAMWANTQMQLPSGQMISQGTLAFAGADQNGIINGRPWGQASLATPAFSAQQIAGQIWGSNWASAGGAANGAIGAMVNGFSVGGKTYYGQQGLQGWQNQFSYDQAMAQAGIQMRSIALQEKGLALNEQFTMGPGGFWSIEDRQRTLSRQQQEASFANQEWGMAQQEKRLALSEKYYGQDVSMQQKQRTMQRSWTKQDWAYQENVRDLQWGWKQEDFQENVRFMTGRDRRLAERQMKRDTIMHDLEGDQIDVQKKRQQELWKLEDTRFNIDKKQHEESVKMQREEMAHDKEMFEQSKRFYNEEKKLQDESTKLQRQYYVEQNKLQREQMALSKESVGLQAHAAQVQKDLNDAMLSYNDYADKQKGLLELAAQSMQTLATAIQNLEKALSEGGLNKPTTIKQTPKEHHEEMYLKNNLYIDSTQFGTIITRLIR